MARKRPKPKRRPARRPSARLRETREQYRAIFRHAPVGIAQLSPSGTYLEVNPRLCVLIGFSRDELVGRSFVDVTHPDDAEKGTALLREVIGGKRQSYSIETRYLRKDGSALWVNVTVAAVGSALSRSRRFVSVVQDMTESKRVGEALAESHRFLDSIVENIPDMLFVKDAEQLRFVRFNRAGERLLGYDRGDLIGKNDYDFFPTEEADFFTRKDREVLEGKGLLDIPEEPIQTAKRGARILHTKKIPIVDAEGRVTHLLGISEDITEKKELERKLREESKLATIGRMAAGLAHEIRNPLFGISAVAQILAAEVAHDPKIRELADGMREEIARLNRLLDDLLFYGRPRKPELAKCDPRLLCGDLLSVHRAMLDARGVRIESTFDPPDTGVYVDTHQIRQVLLNLCLNAIQASPEGDVIRIESRVSGVPPRWIFRIRNRGEAIPPEQLPLVFEPFFTTRREGSGLGLALSKKIIEDHGGTIAVESSEREGTMFEFAIPASAR